MPVIRRPCAMLAMLAIAAPTLLRAQRDTLPLRPALRLIDRFVAMEMARSGTPGLSLALVDSNGAFVVRSYGYADLGRRLPVTPSTRFEIGSISKSFTAIALLQLGDEGRFDPTRPVHGYLPWFTPASRWRPVTGHDLLTHTAGLPADRDDIPSSPAQAYLVRKRTLGSAPGSRFAYSNIGYQVLGNVLERLERERYPTIIRRRILEPLGMSATDAEFTHDTRPTLAIGYLPLHDDRPARPGEPLVEGTWVEYGSGDGAIVSTSRDLGAYLAMLLNGGSGPRGPLMSPKAYAALMTPQALIEPDGDHYGYGMFLGKLGGERVFYHSGGMIGYTSYLIGMPERRIGAIVFINGPGSPGRIGRFTLTALAAALGGDTLPGLPIEPDPHHVEQPARFSGSFVGEGHDTLTFVAAGDSLLLVRGDRRELLLPYGEDSFLGPLPEFALYPLVFTTERDSVTTVHYGGRWYAGPRYTGPRRFSVPAAWRAYPGRYRIMQPWEPDFRVVLRMGRLWWIGPEGNEEPLTPTGPGTFRIGPRGSAETLGFGDVADGAALSATLSGMTYYRYFAP